MLLFNLWSSEGVCKNVLPFPFPSQLSVTCIQCELSSSSQEIHLLGSSPKNGKILEQLRLFMYA